MKVVTRVIDLREELTKVRGEGASIGFVATMGSLHAGHLSLVEAALAANDYVVVSIFVNPTQFGAGEDFEDYPRDLKRDQELLQEAGANLLFAPMASEMYPDGYNTYVENFGKTEVLCGAQRPGHFRGVTTVISKLFNLVQPTIAYFGQKDAQQYAVISQMVRDLNFPIEVVSCPIVRESDGLALSSRNSYLTAEEREEATVLYQALQLAEQLVASGEKDSASIIKQLYDTIAKRKLAKIEYIEIVDARTLQAVEVVAGDILVALAVHFGNTRLIDNTVIRG